MTEKETGNYGKEPQMTSSAIFQWRSLKTRVTLLTLAIFLVCIWSLTFYTNRMLREDMQRLLGEQQFSTVSLIATDINDELDKRLRALEQVAAKITPAILGNTASVQNALSRVLESLQERTIRLAQSMIATR